jgi:hypothetical protein
MKKGFLFMALLLAPTAWSREPPPRSATPPAHTKKHPDAPAVTEDLLKAWESTAPAVRATRGGWNVYAMTFNPEEHKPTGPAQLDSILVMLNERDERRQVATERLKVFLRDIEDIVGLQAEAQGRQPGQDLLIEYRLQPDGRGAFWLMHRPEALDPRFHEAVYRDLMRLRPPPLEPGLGLVMSFKIWGGSGKGSDPRFYP